MAERDTLTLRRTEDDKLREHVERRHRAMLASQEDVADWYEIAGLCMPQRSRALVERHKAKQRNATARSSLYDGHAVRSFEVCANGMLSGLSSRSRPWFRPVLEDEDLMEFHPVSLWLDRVGKMMTSALAMSNFYEAALSCYLEMAGFGTAASIMQGHDTLLSVNYPLTAGEYGLSIGSDNRPDGLSRSFSFDTRQMVEAFVADRGDARSLDWSRVSHRVKEAWDRGNYDTGFIVNQVIETNPAYVPGKIGRIGMPWRSIKWESGCDDRKRFLAIEGYHDQPFMAPRWETLGGDVWGTGRGKKALGTTIADAVADGRIAQAGGGGSAAFPIILHDRIGIEVVGGVWERRGEVADEANRTLGLADAEQALRLGEHRREVDLHLHALNLLGRRRQHSATREDAKQPVKRDLEELAVRAVGHRSELGQLFLVPSSQLLDVPRLHALHVRDRHEQVCIGHAVDGTPGVVHILADLADRLIRHFVDRLDPR